MSDTTRFVTFPLGGQRYALDSCQVRELLMPDRVFSFPHTTPSLEGVLLRRNRVIPVCDLSGVFGSAGQRSFYVVAQCPYEGRNEMVAIPVSGECELVQGVCSEPPRDVTFVAGLLHTSKGKLPLLDLEHVVAHCIQAATAPGREAEQ